MVFLYNLYLKICFPNAFRMISLSSFILLFMMLLFFVVSVSFYHINYYYTAVTVLLVCSLVHSFWGRFLHPTCISMLGVRTQLSIHLWSHSCHSSNKLLNQAVVANRMLASGQWLLYFYYNLYSNDVKCFAVRKDVFTGSL